MVLLRAVLAVALLFGTGVSPATAVDSSSLVTNVQAPFYIRPDESGMLVAVVVHGPAPENQTPIFCSDSPTAFTGPNAMHCLRTSAEDKTYELRLPFSFERDSEGVIIGVNFLDDGSKIVIPFRVTVANGKLHATVVEEEATSSSTITIPYLIQRDDEGGIVAIVLDEGDEEQSIPLRYRTNEDGSVSIVFTEALEKRYTSLKLAILMGCICGTVLAGIAWKTWLYRCRNGETEIDDESYGKPTVPPVQIV